MTTATQARRRGTKVERLKLLTHDTRIDILRRLADGDASPAEVAGEREITIAASSYHFHRLLRARAIRLVKTVPARGTVRHIYAITALGRDILAMAEHL